MAINTTATKHPEAFCLMVYACVGKLSAEADLRTGHLRRMRPCGHLETYWNSRDGVTPFGKMCPSCGGDLQHSDWKGDVYAPNHVPHHGQGCWRDGTPDEAERFIRERITKTIKDAHAKGDSATVMRFTEEYMAALIASARNPDEDFGEFRKGWPMFYRHGMEGLEP